MIALQRLFWTLLLVAVSYDWLVNDKRDEFRTLLHSGS